MENHTRTGDSNHTCAGDSNHKNTRAGLRPGGNLRERLERLATWRIHSSSISLAEGGPEFDGGENEAGEAEGPETVVAAKRMKLVGDRQRVLRLAVREVEFLVNFTHENIVKLEGFVEDIDNGIVWLVFPWEECGHLKDFVASRDWEIPERISLIHDVAQGVEYLHSQEPPVCHGDLKSVNILVNALHRAVITDFGSARYAPSRNNDPNKSNESQPRGSLEVTFCASTTTVTLTGDRFTLRWAAPEVLRDGRMCLASDIWALGWVAYEVMTNYIPFHDVVKDTAVVIRVVRGDLPSVSSHARISLIKALYSVMLKCWNINPRQRPSAAECVQYTNAMPKIVPDRTSTSTATPAPRSSDLLMQLGSIYELQSEYSEALNLYVEALCICKDAADLGGEASALDNLGHIHYLRSEYPEAIEYCNSALEIYTNIGDLHGRATAFESLASLHERIGDYGEAFELYYKSLDLYVEIGCIQGVIETLMELAHLHRNYGEEAKAIRFYSEIVEICTGIGDTEQRAFALDKLRAIDLIQHDSDDTEDIAIYSEDLRIAIEMGDRFTEAHILSDLAEIHLRHVEYGEASKLSSQALEIYESIGHKEGIARALTDLGIAHDLLGEHTEAISFFHRSAEIYEQLNLMDDAARLREFSDRARLRSESEID